MLPGLEAAFVDIGLDKNGFLHVDEIVLPGVETPRRGRGKEGGTKITDLLKPGQEVVVQVVKDPLKTKGARLSMELTIAGRYMVYTPTGEGVGVSKRLDDKERDRLRREARGLDLHGGGAIVRTAASGAKREDFERELQYLFKLHEVLQKRVEEATAPELVFQEADLSVRVVRDIFSADFERALVDDEKQYHRLASFFTRTAPELVDRVELYQDSTPLFEAYGVEDVIKGLISRRVDLPSGGYLMIDYAEALTVIDVNSGSFVGRGKQARLEDTITRTNLEAAEAVVNELRLRDIGGIIVIDFIDMARARNRDAVLKTLRKTLDEDRTKTFTAEISKLGLVEMTRQNVTEGVREIMTRACPVCHGDGVVLSEETIAIEFERRLRELAARALPAARVRAGVDVDDGQRLGVVDDQVAAARQVDALVQRRAHHRVEAEALEQRLLVLVELDALDQLRAGALEERDEAVVLLLVVDERALEVGAEDVAHDAHGEVGLLEDHRGRGGLGGALAEDLVELEEVLDLALEVLLLGARGGRADDRAAALQVEALGLLAQPVALLVA